MCAGRPLAIDSAEFLDASAALETVGSFTVGPTYKDFAALGELVASVTNSRRKLLPVHHLLKSFLCVNMGSNVKAR